MEKIVFLDRSTVKADFRTPDFPHEWTNYSMTEPAEILERLNDATIAITNKVALRKSDLEQLPKLRMIQVAATGMDCVDLDYCRTNNIHVANVKDYSIHSVPEHVFALILALRRQLFSYRREVFAGKWQKSPIFTLLNFPILDLRDATLGIIGYGTLGKAVEKIARAFAMNILIGEHKNAESLREGHVSFDELIAKSDIITLHCPLTDETRDLIDTSELARMKPDALLINCGRGDLVNQNALADALENGLIGGAGIDVLSQEPPRDGNQLLNLDLPNLIITPHIAWASRRAMQTLAETLVDNLENFVSNQVLE